MPQRKFHEDDFILVTDHHLGIYFLCNGRIIENDGEALDGTFMYAVCINTGGKWERVNKIPEFAMKRLVLE